MSVCQQRHGQDSRQVGIEPEHPGSARLNGKAGEPVGGQDQQHQPQQLQVVVRQHRVNGIQPVGEDQPGQQQHRHRQQDLGFRIRRFAADGHACQQADPGNNGQQAHHHTGAAGPRTDRNDLHAVRRNRRDRPSKRIGDLQHTGKCHDAAASQNPKQPLLVIPVQEP